MRRSLVLLLSLVALAPMPAPAPASVGAQEADPVAEMWAAETLVEAKKWGKAYDALRAVLDGHTEDPRLYPYLESIERNMQLCRFRSKVRQLKPKDVLGPGATKLSASSLQTELRFDVPDGPLWELRSGAHTLTPVLVPPITLSFKASGLYERNRLSTVLLQIPGTTSDGILVSPGCFSSSDDRSLGSAAPPAINEEARIWTVTNGERHERANRFAMAYSFENKITVTVKDDETKLKVGGEVLKADVFAGPCRIVIRAGDANDIRVKAKLEPEWGRKRLEEAWDAALDRWVEDEWMRSRHLPDWACSALRRQDEASDFGSGADDVARQLELSRSVFPTARDDEGKARVLPQDVADVYVRGLADLAAGRLARAEAALSQVLEREPRMDRARVWRAWVRTELRRWEAAGADAAALHDAFVGLAPAALAKARVAVQAGDLAAAESALKHALDSPLPHPRLKAFLSCVQRIRQGPGFENANGAIRSRYRVIGGVPEERCAEIAEALATARGRFAALAGDVGERAGQCMVYAFASRQDLDRFVAGLNRYVRSGAAAYLPQVPTLLVDASGDASSWLGDLRKLAWSEHVYRRAELVPYWLYAGGERLLRDGDPATAGPDPAVDPRAFVPANELVRASPDRLRRGSPLVGQSRELVRMLVTHEDPDLRTLPADLVTAMGEGASWADVLTEGPLSERIAAACAAFDALR